MSEIDKTGKLDKYPFAANLAILRRAADPRSVARHKSVLIADLPEGVCPKSCLEPNSSEQAVRHRYLRHSASALALMLP